MRPTIYLPSTALALLAATAGHAHGDVPNTLADVDAVDVSLVAPADTTPAERERARREAERAREQARERARRARRELEEAERELARTEREAQRETRTARAERERAEREAAREAGDDLGSIGRVVGEAVREGMRGAAEGIRAASEAIRSAESDYEDDAGTSPGPTTLDTTVSVGREPTVDLSLVTGPVTVTAWNRSEVRVRGRSDRLPLRFDASGGAVRVYTPRTRTRSAGDQRLEVEVPVGTRVIARSVSGDVRVRGVRGEIEARSTSGDVHAEGGTRSVTLHTVSGNVRGSGLDGVVSVQSVSGDVEIDGVSGELGAQTTSGDVRLRRARVSRLRAESVSGGVAYDGTFARDGRYDLRSHSGNLRLTLPADAGAALSVRTYSGTIDSAIPLVLRPTPRGQDAPRRMEFTVGGGGAQVTAESFSGTITITRP